MDRLFARRRYAVRESTLSVIIMAALFAFASVAIPGTASAVDEDAAKALFKRNDCNKCHAKSRDKKGPSLKKMAKELKEKGAKENKDPEAVAIDQMTKGPKVKLLDSGKEEEHKIIDTKDMKEIKNLANWLLSH
jgi:cytochrome c